MKWAEVGLRYQVDENQVWLSLSVTDIHLHGDATLGEQTVHCILVSYELKSHTYCWEFRGDLNEESRLPLRLCHCCYINKNKYHMYENPELQ